jgi:hypothetical protein
MILKKNITKKKHKRNWKKTMAMFVFRNSLSGKPLSKLSCVCLSLGKLVNGEHFPVNGEYFPVNGKHFPVNKKHFRVKEKFSLIFRKVFFLWLCLFSRKWFPGNHFLNRKPLSKLSCVCLPLEKLVNGKHFPVKGKFSLVFRKVFS